MTPWWNEQAAALIGGIGGGGLGTLGGLYGALMGVLVPRGKGRRAMFTIHALFIAIGAGALLAGIIAVSTGQPHHVWYPLTLVGSLLMLVIGGLTPVLIRGYRAAEARKLDAEALRRG